MAEEKKLEAEKATEEKKEPKVVYSYIVKRYDNGLYDFEGQVLEGAEVPSIDQYHIARDIIEVAPKLEHQLCVEEAEQRVFAKFQQMAMQQAELEAKAKAEAEDPTKA